MTIKPVLVPDHTANDLRRLMDHFAEASTGPTRKQLTESRAAVAAARKTFAESSDDSGAYDKWDPKHPDFVKNYKKFQAKNPGATLKDYIADLKKRVSESSGAQVDMKGKKCTTCKKGTYQETDIQDNMHGELHCTKCNTVVKSRQPADSKKKGVSEENLNEFLAPDGSNYRGGGGGDEPRQFRVIITLYDDSSAEDETAERKIGITVTATSEKAACDLATTMLLKSPRYDGSRITNVTARPVLDEQTMSRAAKGYDEAVAEGSAGNQLKAIDGDYYEDSTDFFSMFDQDHFDREEESEDGMEIRGYIDDVCVMVFKYSTPDMMGGWGNYDDSALIAESGVEDDEEGETCPECDGAGCPECYGDEDRDRAHDHAQGMERESAGMAEATGQQLNIQQLATISDEALDNAYHYGRSTPGNTFGWQANLKSAAYAKQMIDQGVTDIEAISDAIHKGWNVTARAFVQNPEQFSDTEKLQAAGKLEAKLQQREKLMNIGYAQLPDEEQEKDRVVARALLQALKGQSGVAEGVLGDIGSEIGHGVKGLKRTIQGKPSRQAVKDKYRDRSDAAYKAGDRKDAKKNADRWERVHNTTNSGMLEGNNYDQNITVYGNKQGYFAWDKSSPIVRTPLNDEYEITMTSINPHKTGFVDKLKTNMKMTQFKLSQLPSNLQDEIIRILRDYHTAGFQGGLRQYHKNRQDNDLDETAGVKYGVFAKGGSVGSQRFRDDPLKTFDTKEEAVADARRRRSALSPGERGYYGMGYVVKPIRGDVEEGMIDNIKNTVRAANYDRLARRSNSQAVAGGGLAPPAQFKSLSAKGDQRAQKAQDIRKGSAEQVDEIDMGLVGDAVAGAAMGLGSVGLGSYIGHKIGNKIGQKFIDRSNRKEAEAGRKEAEAGSEKMQAIEKARADRIAANKAYRDHENLHGYELAQDHPEYQNRVNLGNKKFRNMDVPSAFDEEQQVDEKSESVRHGNNDHNVYHHVDESIDPVEQLRADIKRFAQ